MPPIVSGPYIGGGGTGAFDPKQWGPMPVGPDGGGTGSGAVGSTPLIPRRPFGGSVKPIVTGPINSGSPSAQPSTPTATFPPNVLGAQSVRPTGPSGGFDPQYVQNLATAIGGLFSRPNGNLSFNPLGNLSDISSPNLGFGNAPSPGLPSTMLQDAINGLAFMFNQPSATAPSGSPAFGGGGNNNGRNGRRPILQ